MPIFDPASLDLRRARAERRSPSFLDARIWDDIAERVAILHSRPARALLLGPMTPAADEFAKRSAIALTTDTGDAPDVGLALAVRWAETEDDLPEKLAALAMVLPPDTPLLGASLGGDTLRALRGALLAADRAGGVALPRSHPRIEPGAFAELLQRAGFVTPVVDMEPVDVRYSSLARLVADLRDLGATNVLAERTRALAGRDWATRLEEAFPPGTTERFDILHFSAWTAGR